MADFDWNDPEWTEFRVAKLRLDGLMHHGIRFDEDAALWLHQTYERTSSTEMTKFAEHFAEQGIDEVDRAMLIRLVN